MDVAGGGVTLAVVAFALDALAADALVKILHVVATGGHHLRSRRRVVAVVAFSVGEALCPEHVHCSHCRACSYATSHQRSP